MDLDRRSFLAAVLAAGLAACSDSRGGRGAGGATTASPGNGPVSSPTSGGDPVTGGATSTTAAAGGAASSAEAGASTSPAGPATPTSAPGGPARFVQHGSRDLTQVAITFHTNGDAAVVTRLLDALRAANAPATFFLVGSWLEQHPPLGDRIVSDGHELANHTYTHPALGRADTAALRHEISGCAQALHQLTGSIGAWFRPSGMEVPTPLVLTEAGRAGYPVVVGYDVDPHDYQDPGATLVRARTKASVRNGSIISLHTGHPGTVVAIDGVLADLGARSLTPVTVSALLA